MGASCPCVSARANAFSDRIEMGTNARQTGLTLRLRGRPYQPSCSCPVERGARRLARHVRERLLEVIPGVPPGVISKFYLMDARPAREYGRAGTTLP